MATAQSKLEALRILARGAFIPALVEERDGWHARWLVSDGTFNPIVDGGMRDLLKPPPSTCGRRVKYETLHDAWVAALRTCTGLLEWDDEAELAAFAASLREWSRDAAGADAAREALRFTLGTRDGAFYIECPRPHGRAAYRALGEALAISPTLRSLALVSDELMRTVLDDEAAERFLRIEVGALQREGCLFDGTPLRAAVAADVEISAPAAHSSASKARAKVTIRVAGEVATAREIRFLLEQKSNLVFFRNRWIEVDRNILRQALRVLERENGREVNRAEAVAFAQGMGALGGVEIASFRAHGWLRGLVNELRAKGEFDGSLFNTDVIARRLADCAFALPLRPYQARGVAWMAFLVSNGFGALLADDMGLGKTAQTLAWLALRKKGAGPVLIVAPLSLVANWRNEFAKFLPDAKVYIHHGDCRHVLEGDFAREANASDAVLTSYNLVVKDAPCFAAVAWDAVVVDEAQAIKNPDTQLARALFALRAPGRIALTGTPVENSVADLWSIENFLNPGFLPGRQEFTEYFTKPIAASRVSAAGKRLRNALEPFMLRRLKGEVASELGEKREIREYCELTQSERLDYEVAYEGYMAGERTRGDVFGLINALKLVCDGMTVDFASSGKFQRLCDLLEAIFAAGESALVFTQYAKVGERLRTELEKRFSCQVPFLEGKLSPKAREREIAAFNEPGPKVFVLSLRTGGLGLNLVKATHVIHYDRWWNPAVEAQATDRAHRIGQTQVVFVHLMIASGTIEDRVDRILERKQGEADVVVSSGEKFLASLAPDEFARLASLEKRSRK